MKKILRLTLIALMIVTISVTVISCKGGGGGPKIKETPQGFKVYKDETTGFKLAYPQEWRVTPFVSRGSCTLSIPRGGALFVKTEKATEYNTVQKKNASFKLRLKAWGDKLEMIKDTSSTLSGYSAQLFIYTMKSEYGNKTQYLIFTNAKGKYWEIIYDGKEEAFKKVKDQIQTVVDTFHIL